MVPIHFDAARSQDLVGKIASGEGIGGYRTANEMLNLAGALAFAAMTHGPKFTGEADQLAGATTEYREFKDEQFMAEIHAAIDFYGTLHMAVNDDTYPEQFEPVIAAFLSIKGDGERKVRVRLASAWGCSTPYQP